MSEPQSQNAYRPLDSFHEQQDIDHYEKAYYQEQFNSPKRSTLAFCDFLEEVDVIKNTSSILDVGSGMGAVLSEFEARWPSISITGIELDENLVNIGQKLLHDRGKTLKLICKDLMELDSDFYGKYDGILSTQTLSWMPDYEAAIGKMISIQPNWLALSSLFYDGPVDCFINITEYFGKEMELERPHTYRIISLPKIKAILKRAGFKVFKYKNFEIDIDLEKPENKLMRTYTERLEGGKRIQFSGPILMPWYFIFAGKG